MSRFTPKTKEDLKGAVNLWISNREKTEEILGHISTWNTILITNMSHLFSGFFKFNDDISNWNVSNVTNMSYMFSHCNKFNQPLNKWDVSNVTSMSYMFDQCFNFNQDINNWNTSSVTNIKDMFYGCRNLKGEFRWDLSNCDEVTNRIPNSDGDILIKFVGSPVEVIYEFRRIL